MDNCLDTGGEKDGDYPDKDGGEEDNLEGDIPGMHNECCVLMVLLICMQVLHQSR